MRRLTFPFEAPEFSDSAKGTAAAMLTQGGLCKPLIEVPPDASPFTTTESPSLDGLKNIIQGYR